jgi:hypothetical protein
MDRDVSAPVAVGTDAKLLPQRQSPRGMLPASWIGRTLKVEYIDARGNAQTTSGKYLDHCGAGLTLGSYGMRMVVAWERVVVYELVPD